MCVRAIDENVLSGNAGGTLQVFEHRIKMLAGDHENVASDDGEFGSMFFEDYRNGAELAFLAYGFACCDPARDDHAVVGFEVGRRCADAQAGGRGRKERDGKCQNDCKLHRRMIHMQG
jgi:hypothetical protein